MIPELDFIEWLRATLKTTIPAGIGDDCAVLPDGKLLTADTIVEGVHFERGTDWYRVGWKAGACALSDIAAMAGRPLYILCSLALRSNLDEKDAKALVKGLSDLCERFDCEFVGGDIVASEVVSVSVSVLGESGGEAIRRSGARQGDCILVTGTLGGSLLGRHLSFLPRINEALWLRNFELHSMIDISDGLLADLDHILIESGCKGAVLYEEGLPLSPDAHKASADGRSALEHCLYDGEDFELLFTTSEEVADQILRLNPFGIPLSRIGKVEGKGLRLRRKGGELSFLSTRGYDHFSKD